jgi:outer membrane lipoprotein-sorting protein
VSETNNRRASDILDEATGALRDAPCPAGPPADLTAGTVAAVKNRLAGTAPASELARRQRRRRVMRYLSFGTAAAVILGLAGLLWFGGPSATARVHKAMDEAAKAKSVRVVQKIDGETVSTTHYRGDNVRFEEPGKRTMILDLKTRKRIELDLVAKTARRYDVTDEEAGELADEFAAARDFLSIFRGIKDATVKELKGEKIGERPAKVYEVSHPGGDKYAPMKATLWIDEKTGFPVRLHDRNHPAGELVHEFDSWNEDFDAKLFDLKIPAGYREVKE